MRSVNVEIIIDVADHNTGMTLHCTFSVLLSPALTGSFLPDLAVQVISRLVD